MKLHIKRIKIENDSFEIDKKSEEEKLNQEFEEYNFIYDAIHFTEDHIILVFRKNKIEKETYRKPPRGIGQ